MKTAFFTEWRTTLRQPSSFTFVILWTVVISLLFLLNRGLPQFDGYTNVLGTIINLLLYLLPLFMLIIGSLSITNELESGQWALLSTYPISTFRYVVGKFVGQLVAQIAVFSVSYGISMVLCTILQFPVSLKWMVLIYLFALFLISFFLGIGILIGTFASTRWQALMSSVVIWFIFIMMWASLLIAILQFVPYPLIANVLGITLFLNPAELVRVFFVVQFGGGAVFGQEFDTLVTFFKMTLSLPVLVIYTVLYLATVLTIAGWKLQRRKL
ncbi:ABC transporter permease [Aquibacillus koreensis]|uniref:ABC transporter permease n=1 Tax=Aquibacillus koreensis TaxID=279446 RepID=A0A9X3WIZ5_9BACI|nr:ABC transporter permease [Aquibacillus koreensis]MCT2536497.1 ABC transporter permease [Aquibacillus koreensis]MDC3419415.1 ABC transporter permease [Aquibacillus koreensis]